MIEEYEDYKDSRGWFDSHHKQIKAALIARDGPVVCKRCGSTKNVIIDHIKPLSAGGNNDMSNLQFLCMSCNGMKCNGRKLFLGMSQEDNDKLLAIQLKFKTTRYEAVAKAINIAFDVLEREENGR